MEKRRIIAIVGSTASGKTAWGVSIARKFNGEIISADSRQVYRQLGIGTGKEGISGLHEKQITRNNPQTNSKSQDSKQYRNTTMEQLRQSIRYIDDVPQWLIDIVDPEEKFTMFDWLDGARIIIEDIFARGKTPIIVGGTGLYVQALTEGFQLEKCQIYNSKLQKKHQNPNIKKYTREELETKSLGELQTIFSKLEIRNWKFEIDSENPRRLIRAIERGQSGENVSKKKPDFEVLQIAVDLPREKLYQRIDQRVDEWFKEGFWEEVEKLLSDGVDPKWLESIGLEYRILTQYLLSHPHAGDDPLTVAPHFHGNDKLFEDMKQKMKFSIHAYARRQLTWFRRFPEIIWAEKLTSAEKAIGDFLQ